jgi:hypothetical protein
MFNSPIRQHQVEERKDKDADNSSAVKEIIGEYNSWILLNIPPEICHLALRSSTKAEHVAQTGAFYRSIGQSYIRLDLRTLQ